MTKRWGSTANMDGRTKQQAPKDERAEARHDLKSIWCERGAAECSAPECQDGCVAERMR